MPHKKPSETSPLVAAAEAFDESLRRFAALAEGLRSTSLDSSHGLGRAADALKEVADCEEDLQAQARTLIGALTTARENQEAQSELVRSRALEIQARSGEYAALLGRFEAIGVEASELNTVTQKLASQRKIGERLGEQGLNETDVSSLLSELGEIEERMAGVVTTSEGLAKDARRADFDDLHRKTDALRQQLLAARNRIGLLKEALAKAVPRTQFS
jgi:ATPase subunit of ABC transporter with duplicated ATPase domains